MREILRGLVLACLALAVMLAMGAAAEAAKGGKPKAEPVEAVIDFSGLPAGQVIYQVSNGAGASGLPGGFIGVFGFNPLFGVSVNAAVVFDSACPPTGLPEDCSGKDPDLGTPNETFGGPGRGTGGEPGPFQNDEPLFNVAIVAEDLVDADGDGLVDDPDDADVRDEFVEFDFRHIQGLNEVTVNSVTYLDNDRGEFNARLEFFGSGTLNPSTIGLTRVGDNGVNTLVPGIQNVSHMRVVLDGSGAVPTVVVNGAPRRSCWVTTGGFDNADTGGASGKKTCTFGGNIGPPPSGAFELNWHEGPFSGSRFHTNDIRAVDCRNESDTGPGQPGGKKGLKEDTLYFECTGLWNGKPGYTCEGFLRDGGEPGGKKNNQPDRIEFYIDLGGVPVAHCVGDLDGGNVQIHPPVGN